MLNKNIPERLQSATLKRLGLEKDALPADVTKQVDRLVSTLGSPDDASRVAAVHMLGKLGMQAPVEVLVHASGDKSDIVRAAAARALGMLGERMPLEPLLHSLHDSSWRVRAAGVQALGAAGERMPVEEIGFLVNDEDASVCIAAVQALGEMGERAPLEPLKFALYDQDWSVREATVLTLEKIGGKEARQLLEEALQDKDAMVREAAEQALQRKTAAQERRSEPANEITRPEPLPLRPQARWRRVQSRFSLRSPGRIAAALVAAACIVATVFTMVPRFFSPLPQAVMGPGSASFASSATNIFSQHDGTLGVNDELLITISSPQPLASGKSYYGWLLANTTNLKAAIPLGKLIAHQGRISYLYKNPTRQNLLLTAGYFLITEEDAHVTPLAPTRDRTKWLCSAEISDVANPTGSQYHYSLLDSLQRLLAKDPTLESKGLMGGAGFWLTRNAGKVGEYAQGTQEYWKMQDTRQMRSQIISMLNYLDGTSSVYKDLPPGTSLQPVQADAPVGILVTDPQGLLAHTSVYLTAIAHNPYASADQRAQATRLLGEVSKINVQCEMVHQDARALMQMTDAQLLQSSSLSLINAMTTHAAFAFTGNSQIGMEGAVQVFKDIQGLASFKVKAEQH